LPPLPPMYCSNRKASLRDWLHADSIAVRRLKVEPVASGGDVGGHGQHWTTKTCLDLDDVSNTSRRSPDHAEDPGSSQKGLIVLRRSYGRSSPFRDEKIKKCSNALRNQSALLATIVSSTTNPWSMASARTRSATTSTTARPDQAVQLHHGQQAGSGIG